VVKQNRNREGKAATREQKKAAYKGRQIREKGKRSQFRFEASQKHGSTKEKVAKFTPSVVSRNQILMKKEIQGRNRHLRMG